MMRWSRFALAFSLSAAATLSPASADPPKSKPVAGDPNERVCEDVIQTGSRIAAKRICATRAEWADKRKQDRDVVDQAQRSPNVGCTVINTHTGTPGC
jgi:hypothetical protein